MFTIRHSMFETNSSSNHVFVFKPNENVSVPSTVELIPDSKESMLQILFNDNYRWYSPNRWGEEEMVEFIDMLYACGVRNIKCSDKNIRELAQERKGISYGSKYLSRGRIFLNDFKCICFGEETKLTTLQDFDVSDKNVKNEFGDGYDYCSVRLS